MSEYVTLREWAINKFGFAPSNTTLTSYAKNKQIHPAPKKFGGKWVCKVDADFLELRPVNDVSDNPLVMRIVNGR